MATTTARATHVVTKIIDGDGHILPLLPTQGAGPRTEVSSVFPPAPLRASGGKGAIQCHADAGRGI
jgi:hypothetical protein